jgi:hypothetical protein
MTLDEPTTPRGEDEVAQLRARIAELEAEKAELEAHPAHDRHRIRSTVSATLIILAIVLAPLSVVSVWASNQISDTDRYVATMAPIGQDPAVQAALTDEITTAIMEKLQVEEVARQLLTTLASGDRVPPSIAALAPGLAVPLTDGIQSFVHDEVAKFISSPEFETVWNEVNRTAHEQVVKLLSGDQSGAISAQGDQITLNLGPIIERVKEQLVNNGFTIAQNLPAIDRTFVLAENSSISDMQLAYRTLNTLGVWLPVLALVLLVIGIALAGDRRRATMRGSFGIVASVVVLGALLTFARVYYVESTPAGILTSDGAGGVFDTMVRFLRSGLRYVGVLFLVIGLAAFVTGPSAGAVRTRQTLAGGIGSLRRSAARAGFRTGGFGTWLHAHRRLLVVVVLVLAGIVLMSWTRPTGWVVVGITVVVLVVLAILEFLATPPGEAAALAVEVDRDREDTLPLEVRPAGSADDEPTTELAGSGSGGSGDTGGSTTS